MNKLLIGLLSVLTVVGALAIWRGAGDDKVQPQMPPLRGAAPRVP